jgi:phospholipid transport system substrate-binding protein
MTVYSLSGARGLPALANQEMRLTTLLVASTWITAGALAANLLCAQGAALATTIPGATAATSTTQQTPGDIIQSAAQRTLSEMRSNRDVYRKDPSKLRSLVEKYLLPHFDMEYAARLVLGQYWRTASHEQRKRFMDAFYHSLLTRYGSALLELTSDRLKVFPTTGDPTADHATVRTEVTRYNADRIAMNFSMHKTSEGWKAYDVSVEGISYIKTYREDFGAQIQQLGLDSLIGHLEEVRSPPTSVTPPTSSSNDTRAADGHWVLAEHSHLSEARRCAPQLSADGRHASLRTR